MNKIKFTLMVSSVLLGLSNSQAISAQTINFSGDPVQIETDDAVKTTLTGLELVDKPAVRKTDARETYRDAVYMVVHLSVQNIGQTFSYFGLFNQIKVTSGPNLATEVDFAPPMTTSDKQLVAAFQGALHPADSSLQVITAQSTAVFDFLYPVNPVDTVTVSFSQLQGGTINVIAHAAQTDDGFFERSDK